eukprot:TRINITY_DN3944_c0_g1_i1.p1 TRINITY_DN3944_c0_g1~~TRINITY_DN3944_c0_g1_i1.p1  ORF type:complete len:776 (-),score=180.37 TRINITY_DN3944_c0_g1_i1:183-2510(-)
MCIRDRSNLVNIRKTETGLMLLETMLSFENIRQCFLQSPSFFSKEHYQTGILVNEINVFCSALNLSSVPSEFPDLGKTNFPHPQIMSSTSVDSVTCSIQEKLELVIDRVTNLIKILIKANWSKVHELFAHIILLHKDREKTFSSGFTIANSDGFYLNFLNLLLRLCEPFCNSIDVILQEKSLINVNQIVNEPFLSDVSRIASVPETYVPEKPADTHFMSQIFFVTLHALHHYQGISKKHLQFLESVSAAHSRGSPQDPTFLAMITQKLSWDVQMLNTNFVRRLFYFMSFSSALSIHLSGFPLEQIIKKGSFDLDSIQIPEDVPPLYASLPGYFAEDIAKTLLYYRQSHPKTLTNSEYLWCLGVIISLSLLWIRERKLLPNYHARKEHVFLIYSFVPDERRSARSGDEDLTFLLKEFPLLKEYLLPSLMLFSIDVEKTGTNNQFYEKFGYRQIAYSIVIYLTEFDKRNWTVPFMNSLTNWIGNDAEKFVQFVMLLFNDLIYLLDDSLAKLKEIREYEHLEEEEKSGQPLYQQIPPEERFIRRQNQEQNKKLVKPALSLLLHYYKMLSALTKLVQKPFLVPEIIQKIVHNLNFSINKFNGKNAKDYKVACKEEIGFDVRSYMRVIIQVYVNFVEFPEFIETIVSDERSFNLEIFQRTGKILEENNLVDQEDLKTFRLLFERLKEKSEDLLNSDKPDINLDEVPEEFIDPIVTEIMTDPVLLPTSNTVVDRLTIIKHLLNDQTDPFNRKKLTKDMIQPLPELKAKIDAFLAEKGIKPK